MVSWIPFRAQSLTDSLVMFSKILNPTTLIGMNLRENSYLIAFLLVLIFIATWAANQFIHPWLQKRPRVQTPLILAQYTIAILFILVFLRPINQFIYFQF